MRKLYSLLLSSFILSTAFAQIPTNGLVAEWKFTDGTVIDSVNIVPGSAQLGAVPTTDRFGNADNAYDLPPAGYLTFGDLYDDITTGLNATFSFSFWVKFDVVDGTARYIIGKAAFEGLCSLAGRQFVIGVNTSNRIEAQLFGALTGGHKKYQSSGTVNAGAWTHIAVSVAVNSLVANPNSVPVMYINGVAQTVTSNEAVGTELTANGMDNGSAHFSAGRYNNNQGNPCATTQYLDGQFDDLRVYNRMLSAQDALALYNETAPGSGCSAAVVTSQPASSVGICEGSTTATISVAVAEQTTTILWQYNDGNGWGDLTGETATDLEVALDGEYRAQLTADCGTVSYSDVCTVSGTGPVINTPLASELYICPSVGSRDITIDATGQNITYQWQSSPGNPGNMADIQGATDATYSATAAQTYYQVIVSACGVDVTSNQVVVQNGSDNSITVAGFAPGLGTICIGQSVTIVTQVAQSSSFVWSPANGTGNGQYLVSPTETTTYTVTATSNTFGCSATATATVTVVDPQPEIVENMGTLEITGGTFNGFQWYLDGNIIQGAVSATYTPTADGDYTVYVVQGSCTGTSAPYAYTGVPTGIAGASKNPLKVYPNPFNSEFVIETSELTTISVMNTLGEVVLSRTINGRTAIDASNIAVGIYFIREETSGAVMKLVKN